MLPVELDFRAAPGADSRLGRMLALAGTIALAVVVAIYGYLLYAQREAERDRSTQRADTRKQAAADRAAAQYDPDGDVMRRLSRPWQKLLLAIESIGDEKVALLEIRPDAGRKTVRLSGEAPTLEDALAYLKKMQGLEVMARAYLVNYGAAPNGGIRFILQAEWAGA